jgi:hypothetical protein
MHWAPQRNAGSTYEALLYSSSTKILAREYSPGILYTNHNTCTCQEVSAILSWYGSKHMIMCVDPTSLCRIGPLMSCQSQGLPEHRCKCQ